MFLPYVYMMSRMTYTYYDDIYIYISLHIHVFKHHINPVKYNLQRCKVQINYMR